MLIPPLVQAQNRVPDCVRVTSQARWGAAGYNHIVTVANGCERPVSCEVATDVNPRPTHIDVPAGESREVTTYLDSPARAFSPRVQCEYAR